MSTTTGVITGRLVDAETAADLEHHKGELIKWGDGSVRAAWKLGQRIDHHNVRYTLGQLSKAMNLSAAQLGRYARLFRTYQRADLAVAASRQLGTFSITLLVDLYDHNGPVEHGRSLRGRRWVSKCQNCGGHDVARIEVDPETLEPLEEGEHE